MTNQSFSSLAVADSVLWDDSSPRGSEILIDEGNQGTVSFGNSDVDQTLPQGTDAGGNINSDPLFYNAPIDNFHIKNTSPAKDAGNGCDGNATDLDGRPRCQNNTEDMGAYESVECTQDSNCVDAHGCMAACDTTFGVCQWPEPLDCNCNGVPD